MPFELQVLRFKVRLLPSVYDSADGRELSLDTLFVLTSLTLAPRDILSSNVSNVASTCDCDICDLNVLSEEPSADIAVLHTSSVAGITAGRARDMLLMLPLDLRLSPALLGAELESFSDLTLSSLSSTESILPGTDSRRISCSPSCSI